MRNKKKVMLIKGGMKKGRVCFLALLLINYYLLSAYDAGLVLDQTFAYEGAGDDNTFTLNGILIPRLSGLLGDNGQYFISAGLNYQNNPWGFIPELIEAELFFNFNGGDFRIGRTMYQDPLGFIIDGYFDGGQLNFDTRYGVFSAGAWYTGFICKRRANIEMTVEEYRHNNAAIDYNDFFDTYFAPRRLFSALEWEHPILSQHLRLKMSLIGQFDLSEEELNSQYVVAKMTMPFGLFTFDLGGSFNLIQHSGNMERAFAAELGFGWMWQRQGLSFLGRYSSGYFGSLTPFLPVVSVSQGNVNKLPLIGMTVLSLDYNMRINQELSFNIRPAYFIDNYDEDGGLWGAEIFGKIDWSPFSDIKFSLGGGVFLPSLGNFAPDDKSIWKAEANVVVSFF